MENKQNWVFFLHLENNLPANFFALSQSLKKLGHYLVPITLDQLPMFCEKKDAINVLVMTTNLNQISFFRSILKKRLKFYLANRKVVIHHFSSFVLERGDFLKPSVYQHYALPSPATFLLKKMITYCERNKIHALNWPGGTRAKLPTV